MARESVIPTFLQPEITPYASVEIVRPRLTSATNTVLLDRLLTQPETRDERADRIFAEEREDLLRDERRELGDGACGSGCGYCGACR